MLIVRDLSLELDDITLRFSARVQMGDVVLMRQPSGSGKSTFFHLLSGLISPSFGTATWCGDNLISLEERPIAIQYQDLRLFPFLTLAENIRLGWSPKGHLTPSQEKTMTEMMRALGILGLANRPARQLSGGEQRRTAILRALGKARRYSKALLLLDEPLAGLDKENSNKVCQLLKSELIRRQSTMIIASHQTLTMASLHLSPASKVTIHRP